jgi:hypothetical protein
METHLKALLTALALLALYALPAAAQDGSITITIDCGAPESITVRNDTDEALVLESVNSSEGQTSDVEIDLGNTEVAAGASETINFGDMAGGGNIFNNDLEETATVMISGMERQLMCDNGDVVTETFQIGERTPEPSPDNVPPTPEPPTMPTTGGGGLATGASVPWGSLGLAASGLLAAGYAVLRRR